MWHLGKKAGRLSRHWPASIAVCVAILTASGCTPSLHDVIGRGDIDLARTLLQENPARVADENSLGKQPLQYAVMYQQMDAMEALLEAGADVNAADNTGMTALQAAVIYSWEDGIRWLLEHGADPAQRDHFGDLPSHTAAMYGRGGVLGVLAEHGVSLTEKNNKGMTPLDLAHKHRVTRTAQRLEQLIAQAPAAS